MMDEKRPLLSGSSLIPHPVALEETMSDPSILREDLPKRHSAQPSLDRDPGAVSQHVRCRLAVGSGSGFTVEMSHLLRTRLRLAILIVLVGFALHFLRNLLLLRSAFDHRPLWLVFVGCEIVVMAIASALL